MSPPKTVVNLTELKCLPSPLPLRQRGDVCNGRKPLRARLKLPTSICRTPNKSDDWHISSGDHLHACTQGCLSLSTRPRGRAGIICPHPRALPLLTAPSRLGHILAAIRLFTCQRAIRCYARQAARFGGFASPCVPSFAVGMVGGVNLGSTVHRFFCPPRRFSSSGQSLAVFGVCSCREVPGSVGGPSCWSTADTNFSAPASRSAGSSISGGGSACGAAGRTARRPPPRGCARGALAVPARPRRAACRAAD